MAAAESRLRTVVYDDDICRAFSLATVVWGAVALLLGVIVATQLSFWQANLETSWLSFGRLRPLHTNGAKVLQLSGENASAESLCRLAMARAG